MNLSPAQAIFIFCGCRSLPRLLLLISVAEYCARHLDHNSRVRRKQWEVVICIHVRGYPSEHELCIQVLSAFRGLPRDVHTSSCTQKLSTDAECAHNSSPRTCSTRPCCLPCKGDNFLATTSRWRRSTHSRCTLLWQVLLCSSF